MGTRERLLYGEGHLGGGAVGFGRGVRPTHDEPAQRELMKKKILIFFFFLISLQVPPIGQT